jgi:hypothetical protein
MDEDLFLLFKPCIHSSKCNFEQPSKLPVEITGQSRHGPSAAHNNIIYLGRRSQTHLRFHGFEILLRQFAVGEEMRRVIRMFPSDEGKL